jgi:hypothetical protein
VDLLVEIVLFDFFDGNLSDSEATGDWSVRCTALHVGCEVVERGAESASGEGQTKGCGLRSDGLMGCPTSIGDVGFATDETAAVKNTARAGPERYYT